MEPIKLRKCYVLREQEILMRDLKKGDLFWMEKASPDDPVMESDWSIATGDSQLCAPEGNAIITMETVRFMSQETEDEMYPNFKERSDV